MATGGKLESPLLTLRTHPKVLFLPVVVQIILLAGHFAILSYLPHSGADEFDKWLRIILHCAIGLAELIYCIVPMLRWITSTFEVTTHRVFTHEGIIARVHKEIAIPRIAQVVVERGLLDRIFGSGTIKLYDATNTLGLEFRDVPKVAEVKAMLDENKGLS